jgi:hypothetical protein
VPEQIGAFEHARHSFNCRRVQRDHAMARLVLAPSNVQQPLDEIHVGPAHVLEFHRTHRSVRRHDRGAIDVLPFGIRGGDVEQTTPFLARQRPADGSLALWQIIDVVSECSPSAAELQHPRQHPDIHVNRAISDAGVMTGAQRDRRSSGISSSETQQVQRRIGRIPQDPGFVGDSGKDRLEPVVEVPADRFRGGLHDAFHRSAEQRRRAFGSVKLFVPLLGPEQKIQPSPPGIRNIT